MSPDLLTIAVAGVKAAHDVSPISLTQRRNLEIWWYNNEQGEVLVEVRAAVVRNLADWSSERPIVLVG